MKHCPAKQITDLFSKPSGDGHSALGKLIEYARFPSPLVILHFRENLPTNDLPWSLRRGPGLGLRTEAPFSLPASLPWLLCVWKRAVTCPPGCRSARVCCLCRSPGGMCLCTWFLAKCRCSDATILHSQPTVPAACGVCTPSRGGSWPCPSPALVHCT